ncbi:gp125 (endogenous virus) [Lactococcus phage KSY1]|uniref:Gp125 n=1 Tax=Lactococcus phage KSY1 TaxID=2913972 RepID=A6MAJ0_9CAUD|nr:gp125 [Lactococcus phage KSY1]ABG21668.1 gp125 [Lactococcus phage KSY1]
MKNKLTGLWLMRDEVDKVYPYDHTSDIRNRDTFTQQDIDSMQTGSYEQVEVD